MVGTKRTLNTGTPGVLCDGQCRTENRALIRKSRYVVHGDSLRPLFPLYSIMLCQI